MEDPVGIHSNVVPGSGATGQAIQKAESKLSNDITAEPKYDRELDSASSIHPRNTLIVPLSPPESMNLDAVQLRDKFKLPKHGAVLTTKGPVFGLIQLVNKLGGKDFSLEELEAIQGLGRMAAMHLLRAASRQGYATASPQRKKSVVALLGGSTPTASPKPSTPTASPKPAAS